MNNQCRSENIYDKCAYRNCYNGRFSTGAHLFRFPLNTDARYTIWIHNSGKFLTFFLYLLLYFICVVYCQSILNNAFCFLLYNLS